MWVGWPKCGSDPRDEGHLACLPLFYKPHSLNPTSSYSNNFLNFAISLVVQH